MGNQVGSGDGKKIATAAGAVAGGYAGNKVQKHMQENNTETVDGEPLPDRATTTRKPRRALTSLTLLDGQQHVVSAWITTRAIGFASKTAWSTSANLQ